MGERLLCLHHFLEICSNCVDEIGAIDLLNIFSSAKLGKVSCHNSALNGVKAGLFKLVSKGAKRSVFVQFTALAECA